MNKEEAVDSIAAPLRRRLGMFFLFALILVGAAAAPTHALAAGCSGTGACYWVGGTGNWSDTTKWATATGGGTTGGLPAATDSVHFDANSNTTAYTVTVDTTANMNDLMFDAAPSVSGTVTWAGSSAMSIYGSMSLLSGMTRTFSGGITFRATTTGKTITSNAIVFASSIVFNGVGGGWTLQDAFGTTYYMVITLTNGSLDTNGKGVTGSITAAAAVTLTLGASTVTTGTGWSVQPGTTLSAASSIINYSDNGGNFVGGGKTYGTVTYSAAGTSVFQIQGANTFGTLGFSGSTYQPIVSFDSNQVVSGTLSATGVNASVRAYLYSNTVGTARTITAAAVSLTDVDFTDITGAGAAAPFTGTRLGNAAGNSGITFTAPANKYYVGNTANWSGTVWALTSGGAAAVNNFPLPQDTVILDANSFNANGQTLTIDSTFRLPSIVSSGTDQTYTIATAGNLAYLYGATYTLDSNTTISGTNSVLFVGRITQTFTSAGKAFTQPVVIDTLAGSLVLADQMTIPAASNLTLLSGTLNLNGMALYTGRFYTTGNTSRAITSNGGTMYLTGNGRAILEISSNTGFTRNDAWNVVANYSGATGTREMYGVLTEAQAPSISVTAGTDTIQGSGTLYCKDLNITGFAGTFGQTTRFIYGNLTLPSGVTYTAGTNALTLAATSGTQVITTNAAGTLDFPITFDGVGGTFQLADNLTMGATRTATLTNGTLNLSGKTLSTGIFSSSNSNTRSITSGGGGITLTGNAAVVWNTNPGINLTFTDALIVNSSYSGSTGTRTFNGNTNANVTLNISAGSDIIAMNNTNGAINFTGFSGSLTNSGFNVAGNLTISSGMTVSTSANILTFNSTSGTQVITTNGKTLDFPITINAPGATVQLADNLTMGATRTLTHTAGTLDLNGKTLSTGIFSTSGSTARTIKSSVSGGKIATTYTTAGTVFDATTGTNLTVDRATNPWTIEIGGNTTNTHTFAGGGLTWPALSFTNTTASGELDFTGSNTFKSLSATAPPQTVKFTTGTNTTIEDTTTGFPSGTSGNLVTVGTISGTATLTKSGGGRVCSDYLSLSNLTGSPATTAWYVGANSSGSGTGLLFSACPSVPATNPIVPHATAGQLTATGGTISTVTQGGVTYRVHTFATTGTSSFRVTGGSGNVQYLVVGGGGGGGGANSDAAGGAGGAAGGMRSNAAYDYPVSGGTYTVIVGAGGAGGLPTSPAYGTSGNDSVFGTITSTGGGYGGGAFGGTGGTGGSGGGTTATNGAGGKGTAGQGNNGGAGAGGSPLNTPAGGGGGASAAGGAGTSGSGGNGGAGSANSISGTSVIYAGGGGGGVSSTGGITGTGGTGGGGTGGASGNGTGSAGTNGLGGGGGGASWNSGGGYAGGSGGSGIVIIRYPIATTAIKPGCIPATVVGQDGLTYGTVLGADGKCWLDRNLGATRVATAYNDQWAGYGSYYQWGRSYDGHQATTSSVASFSGIVTTAAAVSAPDTAKFVATTTSPYDWLNAQNNNLWQGVNGTNNPCPTGFRIPTQPEWASLVTAAGITNRATAFNSSLKLPSAGYRNRTTGVLSVQGSYGFFWSSSISGSNASDVYVDSTNVPGLADANGRGFGFSVRCIRDSKAIKAKVNTSQNSKINNGLVGLWSFDAPDMAGVTAYDRSGQGNNAVLNGGVVKGIGKLGQALNLNGVDGYVVTGNVPLNSAFTASVWVKPGTSPQAGPGYVRILETAYTTGFYIGTDTTKTKYQLIVNNSSLGSNIDPTNFIVGKWDHLVLVVNGTSAKLYRNGVIIIDATITALGAVSLPLYIGAYSGSPSSTWNWNGSVDDVRVYNRVLTPAEIKLLYTFGK